MMSKWPMNLELRNGEIRRNCFVDIFTPAQCPRFKSCGHYGTAIIMEHEKSETALSTCPILIQPFASFINFNYE